MRLRVLLAGVLEQKVRLHTDHQYPVEMEKLERGRNATTVVSGVEKIHGA